MSAYRSANSSTSIRAQTLEDRAEALLEEARSTTVGNSQPAALFSWEVGVQAAASANLAALMALVPAEKRNSISCQEGLDEAPGSLASAAVGKDHADDDIGLRHGMNRPITLR